MKNKGITLIALVITIVVLIILAGVTLNLTLGQNGIFKKAEEAKRKENEASARENVEIVLVDARIEKETNTAYNKEAFLDDMLEQSGITVEENIVILDNYSFLIDREKLQIVENLGETLIKLNTQVQSYLGANENGKYEVSVLVTVESNSNLQSITIENPDGTTNEVIPEGTSASKTLEIELDETYTITAITVYGKAGTRKLKEKSIENIRTVEQLVAFRDKVDAGLTYEGKTINVVNDLDLSSVCYKVDGTVANDVSWNPIGTLTAYFKGRFDGNYNKIKSLYINSNTSENQGLFDYNYGTIQNLILEDVYVNNSYSSANISRTGGISASSHGIIQNCGVNSGTVKAANSRTTGAVRVLVGGIASGCTRIENCYNKAEVIGEVYSTTSKASSEVGGIVGRNERGTVISCYNSGVISGKSINYNCSGGIAGRLIDGGTITNSYNKGVISGTVSTSTNLIGGIVGQNSYIYTTTYGSIKNSYYLEGTTTYGYYKDTTASTGGITEAEVLNGYASTLGDAFTNDVKIKVINAETGLEEEVWSNDGFPILKWQIGQ